MPISETPTAGLAEHLAALPDAEFELAYAGVMTAARAAGIVGFGGECWVAAVAINRVVFGGKAELAAGVNVPLHEAGVNIGHAAVLARGAFWDAHGHPKEQSDIDSFGMLDPEDRDYRQTFRDAGVRWTQNRAANAAVIVYDNEEEFLDDQGMSHSDIIVIETMLEKAGREWLEQAMAPSAAPGPR